MKLLPFMCVSAVAALLSGCGGSDPVPTTSSDRVVLGAAHSPDGSVAVPQLDEPLRIDQIPDIGKAPAARQGGRYRQGDALPGLAINTQDREAVRMFYNGLYVGVKEPAMNWTGSYITGAAGATSAEYAAFTLQRANWFRAMAGVPANLQLSADWSAKDQEAALLMSVNGQLSHNPPSTWQLYSANAADGASHSSLTQSVGANAIVNYVWDNGSNNAPAGHRRSLFYPQTKTVGLGSVPGGIYKGVAATPANAYWNYDENFFGPRPSVRDDFVAWPPRGYVPYQVTYGRWSLSYPKADFSTASVVVTKNGVNIGVKIEPVVTGYAENTIVWLLAGTTDMTVASKPDSDQRYSVSVSNVIVDGKPRTFNYDVIVFDPAVATSGAVTSSVTAPALPNIGTPFGVSMSPVPNATGFDILQYQRIQLPVTLFNTSNVAGNWLLQTSGSYDSKAGGTFSLHHETFADQILVFSRVLLARAQPSISFTRSTGFATAKESLKVQVTLDDGMSWNDVYSESGTDAPTSASNVTVDLTKYTGRKLGFRFLVTQNGPYYSCSTCGWNLSDITISNLDELINPQTFSFGAGVTTGSMQIATPGDYALFGRTQLQSRYYSDVGTATLLHANGAILTGPRNNYTITKLDLNYTITDNVGRDGVQTVVNPMRLAFKDVSIAFDTSGNAGAAYRLYQAAFDRKPDLPGMGFWLKALDAGSSSSYVARGFMASDEFRALYGSAPTNEQLIKGLYRNVLHREPEPAGFDWWMKVLQSGYPREDVLVAFADSQENRDQVAQSVASGIEYIPFK